MQKGLAPIIIVLILAVVILLTGGAYYFGRITAPKNDFFDQNPMVFPSQKPQPTAKPAPDTSTRTNTADETVNWKTYINTKVGFSLRYPSRYPDKPLIPSGLGDEAYSDGTEDAGSPIFGKTTDDSIQLEFFPFIGTIDELIINERVKSFPPYAWVYGTPYLDKRYNTITSKEYTVDGIKSRWITVNNSGYYADSPKERDDGIFFIAKGYGFILHTSNHDQQEIVQMLSTFKFLE